MKTISITLILLLAGLMAKGQSEQAAIMLTLNNFLDGGTNGDVDQFKNAFLADAVQRSVGSNGQIIGMSVASLASKIKPGQKMERQTKVVSWSYSGVAATATTETVYATSKIIDYLNLVKVGSDWKIATRVYSRINSDEQVSSSVGTSAQPKNSKETPKSSAPAKKGKVVLGDDW